MVGCGGDIAQPKPQLITGLQEVPAVAVSLCYRLLFEAGYRGCAFASPLRWEIMRLPLFVDMHMVVPPDKRYMPCVYVSQ